MSDHDGNQMEFSPPPEAARSWDGVVIPRWFDSEMPGELDRGTRESLNNVESESSPALLEAYYYARDMRLLQNALYYLSYKMLRILTLLQGENPQDTALEALLCTIEDSFDAIEDMFFLQCDDDDGNNLGFTMEESLTIREQLEREEGMLDTIRPRLFEVERFLVEKEASLLAAGDRFLWGLMRFERCRHRDYLKRSVEAMQTERLKQVDYTENVLYSWERGTTREAITMPPLRPDDTSCLICYDEFAGEDGEIAVDPMVTTCCRRPFHVACMLGWLFQKMDDRDEYEDEEEMSCPMCRAEVDVDSFVDLLEIQVRQMDAL
ncbi:hypothetical protein AYO22_11029 [Fonsecaea multimorphosa]|nr:hypothetical protein AYO22_11029 [Fonsecaea multimorphosa]